MTDQLFIEAAAVAALLEIPTASAFLLRRATLERDHGFPAPLPWCQRPLKWRREDVIRWRDNCYDAPDLSAVTGAARGDMARRVVMLQEARRA